MTKFEQIGVERQVECDSKHEALKTFSHSCYVCCCRGMKIDCDRCAIAHVHKEVIACFEDSENRSKQAKICAKI